jgi:hypothetical protein
MPVCELCLARKFHGNEALAVSYPILVSVTSLPPRWLLISAFAAVQNGRRSEVCSRLVYLVYWRVVLPVLRV